MSIAYNDTTSTFFSGNNCSLAKKFARSSFEGRVL